MRSSFGIPYWFSVQERWNPPTNIPTKWILFWETFIPKYMNVPVIVHWLTPEQSYETISVKSQGFMIWQQNPDSSVPKLCIQTMHLEQIPELEHNPNFMYHTKRLMDELTIAIFTPFFVAMNIPSLNRTIYIEEEKIEEEINTKKILLQLLSELDTESETESEPDEDDELLLFSSDDIFYI